MVLRILEEVARHYIGGVGYQVVYGIVIILFIVGMPNGLVGAARRLFRVRKAKPAAAAPAETAP